MLPARLFVSVGGLEEDYIPGFERLSEALKANDYDGLDRELVILDGETHMSTWPRAFTMGMKMVFAEWDGSYRYDP